MKLKDMENLPDSDCLEIWYDCDLTLGDDEILRCPWFEAEDIANIASSGEPDNIRFAYRAIGKEAELNDTLPRNMPQAVAILWHPLYVERVARTVWVCFDKKPKHNSEFHLLWQADVAEGQIAPTNGGVFR